MSNPTQIILSGNLSLDKNGERLFLVTSKFGPSDVLRLVQDNFDIFPEDLLLGRVRSIDVTVTGHVANDEERRRHDQLTEPTIVVEKIVPFELIRERAFEIFQSGSDRSAEENWLRAERELLAVSA